jgi:phosphate butyryltransferase
MLKRVEDIWTEAQGLNPTPRLLVAGAENAAALETAVAAHQRGLVCSTLTGNVDAIRAVADAESLSLDGIELIDADGPAQAVAECLERIQAGQADVLMKGQVSTHVLLKGVLDRKYGFRTERALSHISAFNVPGEDRILIITDAGVNVEPDLQRKHDILLNAVDLGHALGCECPKVAVMSFVEEITDPKIASLADAKALREMYLTGEFPGCIVEGPYSFDVALSVEAAKIKGVEGEVAGRADIIVMNDIGVGNILYKALLLWVKPTIASVVLGARFPMVVPSRADSRETKLNSVAMALLVLRHLRAKDL